MKLKLENLNARIPRALAACGKGTKYQLGRGDLDNVHPKCDCTGFVAHCCGIHRDPAKSGGKRKRPVETTSIWKDAMGKQEEWVRLDGPIPGCIVVRPDRGSEQGHAGIVEKKANGKLIGFDCGVSKGISHRNLNWMFKGRQDVIFVTMRSDVDL